MLKGHVFEKQIFGNQIFALFINTFLNGVNGISNDYKNGMKVTYSGSSVTVQSGAVCIQGRFLEEDTSTTISAGTDTAYCKLVVEINLDKQNTESDFTQAEYKVVKSTTGYPSLTQTDIVNNNSGIYQYELARFKTGTNGITEFYDRRTFLDFDSIYKEIQQHIQDIDNGALYIQKSSFATVTGTIVLPASGDETVSANITVGYPVGFKKDNCVVISIMSHNDVRTDRWSTPGPNDGLSMLLGNGSLISSLTEDGVWVSAEKANSGEDSKTITVKIVLMKIA